MRTANGLMILVVGFVLVGCGRGASNENGGDTLAQTQSVACQAEMKARFDQLETAQTAWYKAHTSVLPDASQRARLDIGSNGKAVLVVHGFISSPAYVQEIAKPLHDQGYTVLSPLLTGFGTDATAANSATADDWRKSVEDGVHLLKTCFTDISIVAHSLAAAIVTDEIENRHLDTPSHLVLLSPYFKTQGQWPTLLASVLATRVDVLDLDTFRRVTGGLDPYAYLPINHPLPGAPEPYLPIPALNRVLELQRGFTSASPNKIPSPGLTVVSLADGVIDAGFSLNYIHDNLPAEKTLVFDANSGVSHSLQLRENNPRFDEMLKEILEALK